MPPVAAVPSVGQCVKALLDLLRGEGCAAPEMLGTD